MTIDRYTIYLGNDAIVRSDSLENACQTIRAIYGYRYDPETQTINGVQLEYDHDAIRISDTGIGSE